MPAPTTPSTPKSTTPAAKPSSPAPTPASTPLLALTITRDDKHVFVNGKPFPTVAQARLYALKLLAALQ